MEYIAFIHGNTTSPSTDEEWRGFLELAKSRGMFRGGSEISRGFLAGPGPVPEITARIEGFMLFETDSPGDLRELFQKHPTVIHGGTLEVCEMPLSR